jgi:hypothetical protein
MSAIPNSTEAPDARDLVTDVRVPKDRRTFEKTKKRTVTRRGVMWLGQTCDARCYFCYFLDRIADNHHAEHAFMTMEKAKEICHTLRYTYGHTSIDIQGGEPTIYPPILELIQYCNEIGLYPTLITNGLSLAKPGRLEKFKEAGVRDFLVSLHGLGETHDEVVCRKGASAKIITAIERMVELDIPFRFNCTMSKPVVAQLPDIARKAVEYGANAVNFIAFNPFGDQEGKRTADGVASYTEIKPYLTEAMDILDDHGIECNVRYLPICIAEPRHRKNFYNMQQLTYDHHEWNYESWLWTMMQPQMMKEGPTAPAGLIGVGAGRMYRGPLKVPGDEKVYYGAVDVPGRIRDIYHKHKVLGPMAMTAQHAASKVMQAVKGKEALLRTEAKVRAAVDCQYKYEPTCAECACKNICDGFHGDYAEFFGTGEASPITDMPPTDDPLYFIREQEKIVEEEDKHWAL